jgi:Ser/Thr protein kinase RdoA (MazF antagonist)
VLTFWRYVEPGAKSSDGDRLLGEAVRRFHSALAGIAGELPRLTEKIDQANELLQNAKATPRLTAADRADAANARDRLATFVRSLGQATALHAEPHEGNVLWTSRGPVLIDFEAACLGPAEWDLAYLATPALDSFPERDDEAIARLRAGISFCVAGWCLADPDPTPAVAEAAAVHLEAFRESWLVRQRSSP